MERGQLSEQERENLRIQLESDVGHLEFEIDKKLKETESTKKMFRKI